RFGPRRVLLGALTFLGLGQVLLAVAHTYALALIARGVLGLGDALTFVSVLRLAANHFPGRQYMLVTALTGALGLVGYLATTLTWSMIIAVPGLTPPYLFDVLVTRAFTVVVTLRVRDTPTSRTTAAPTASATEVLAQLRAALRIPGTRLGFWTHFTTPFGQN